MMALMQVSWWRLPSYTDVMMMLTLVVPVPA